MATAESCTGGLISAACTARAGSSAWFERGFVTYSNEAKTELLGVPDALLAAQGAVCEPVARAMALGAVQHSRAQVSLAVTGIAGPGGASAAKPVGTVWFGWCVDGVAHTQGLRFEGDRTAVRSATVAHALQRLADLVQASTSARSPLVQLRGLGPRSASLLSHAGIHTVAQLREADPYRVYLRLRAARPGVSLNLLYALIGAVQEQDWRAVAREQRTDILARLAAMAATASEPPR